jgi:regulator of nucleoside diphosphate kinase
MVPPKWHQSSVNTNRDGHGVPEVSGVGFAEPDSAPGVRFRFRGEAIELPPIHILADDYEVLADVVCRSASATPGVALLWQELQRAIILDTDRAPGGLIHLNSRVRYTDLVDPLQRTVQLVSPARLSGPRHGLSVASPVGAALIGLRVGDRFSWMSGGDRMRMLRVDRVEREPLEVARLEAAQVAERRRLIKELLSAR